MQAIVANLRSTRFYRQLCPDTAKFVSRPFSATIDKDLSLVTSNKRKGNMRPDIKMIAITGAVIPAVLGFRLRIVDIGL